MPGSHETLFGDTGVALKSDQYPTLDSNSESPIILIYDAKYSWQVSSKLLHQERLSASISASSRLYASHEIRSDEER